VEKELGLAIPAPVPAVRAARRDPACTGLTLDLGRGDEDLHAVFTVGPWRYACYRA